MFGFIKKTLKKINQRREALIEKERAHTRVLKRFLLPETAAEYESVAANIRRRTEKSLAKIRQRAACLRQQAEQLRAASGTAAEVEINRRKAEGLESLTKEGNIDRDSVAFQIKKGDREVDALAKTLRQREAEKIAHQGAILRQDYDLPYELARRGDEWIDSEPYRRERRVVLFKGRFFLVVLHYPESHKERSWKQGRYSGYKYLPTGEFGPPEVISATDDAAKMTDEELLVCK